jgi:hypothetical protein
MTFCMSRRILAVGSGPLACRILSRLAIDAAPRSAETGLCGFPNFNFTVFVGRTFFESFFDVMRASSSENNDIEK